LLLRNTRDWLVMDCFGSTEMMAYSDVWRKKDITPPLLECQARVHYGRTLFSVSIIRFSRVYCSTIVRQTITTDVPLHYYNSSSTRASTTSTRNWTRGNWLRRISVYISRTSSFRNRWRVLLRRLPRIFTLGRRFNSEPSNDPRKNIWFFHDYVNDINEKIVITYRFLYVKTEKIHFDYQFV